jgi:hypothetical protein
MTEGLLSDHLLVVDLRERTERRLHEAGPGHPAELWFFDHRCRGDRLELTTIRLAGQEREGS